MPTKTKKQMLRDPRSLSSHMGLKFYTPMAMLFIALSLVINIIGQKVVNIGFNKILLTSDFFIFPIIYIISITLTEVYGFAMSRRIIWLTWLGNLLVTTIIILSILLPPAADWHYQQQFQTILGRTPQMMIASFIAFITGEFTCSYIIARLKVVTEGKYLWLRTSLAFLVGGFIDAFVFGFIAFANILSPQSILMLNISCYFWRLLYQLIFTPAIYPIARFLKKQEGIDIFDKNTSLNPFKLSIK